MVPGHVLEQVDAEVHLEPREPLFLARLQALAVDLGIVRLGGVGVAADLVAELAAEHLPHRYSVGLPGQVPQRHLDAAHASALPSVEAELFDLAENLVHVAGVLAEQAALQHQRVGLAGAVAHLAQPVDALVGVDAEHRAGHGRADQGSHAHVRNLEVGRTGVAVDVLNGCVERLIGPESCGEGSGGAAQKRTAVLQTGFQCVHDFPLRCEVRAIVCAAPTRCNDLSICRMMDACAG